MKEPPQHEVALPIDGFDSLRGAKHRGRRRKYFTSRLSQDRFKRLCFLHNVGDGILTRLEKRKKVVAGRKPIA